MIRKENLTIVFAAMVIVAAGAYGQADYSIPWHSIDSGGGTSTGGPYTLVGVIGQPDAGNVMSGGDFTFNGGFLAGNFGCVVNLTDLAIFCEQWLAVGTGLTADFDTDLNVDIVDFSAFAAWWYYSCPGDWPLK